MPTDVIDVIIAIGVSNLRAYKLTQNLQNRWVNPADVEFVDQLYDENFDQKTLNERLLKQGLALPAKTLVNYDDATESRKKNVENYQKERQADLDNLLKSSNRKIQVQLDALDSTVKDDLKQLINTSFTADAPELTDIKNRNADAANKITSIDGLYALRKDTENAIEAQHKLDGNNLEALFKEPSVFLKTIKDKSLLDDQNINELKANMAAAIDESYKKNLKTLQKRTDDLIIDIDKQNQQNYAKIVYLASLRHNQAIKNLLDPTTPSGVVAFQHVQPPSIDSINLNTLDQQDVRTATGQAIQFDAATKTASIKLPSRFLDLSRIASGDVLYYDSLKNKVKQDMKSMALRIKAEGCDTITYDIQHKDPEHARFIALQAFAAARESGFSEDYITIKCNGKPMPLYSKFNNEGKEIEKGFIPGGQEGKEKQAIDLKAKRFETEMTNFIMKNGDDVRKFQKMKEEVQTARAEAAKRDAAKTEENPSAGPAVPK